MAVSRVKTSSILQGFPKSRSLLAGNTAFNPSSYESIATATAAGGETSFTFSSIPSTYKHLQIRYNVKTAANSALIYLNLNGDSATNYARHFLYGTGTTVAALGTASSAFPAINDVNVGTNTTNPSVGIVDFADYASTSKNKTVKILSGMDANGTGTINLASNLWMNTSAITTIAVIVTGSTYSSGSTFALYGIKG